MSLYDAMMIGVAGLDANSRALSISSSNIANVNTVGYKTSQSAFSTMLAASGQGPDNASGIGVMASAQQNIVQQGLLFSTSSPTDLAISGNGFFCVNTSADKLGQALYTRSGSFVPDADGNLRNSSGLYLMGFPIVNSGKPSTNPTQMQAINLTGLSGKGEATTTMSLQANLQASADIVSGYTAGDMTNGNPPTPPEFQTSANIFDTQGGSQPLKISYIKTDANTWQYEVAYDGDVSNLNPANALVATGTITFDSNGGLASVTDTTGGGSTVSTDGSVDLHMPWSSTSGLQPQDITFDMGTFGKTDGFSQYDSSSVVTARNINGAVFGDVTGVTINPDGTVYANYSNGLTEAAFQIPLATFANADGLAQVSGNAFAQTANSGQALVNPAGTAGSGTIASNSLEGSTVDLATEFTNMITTQRAYSASARVVTTASDMLSELMQMSR
jgi:flagellar hook protein FlgE